MHSSSPTAALSSREHRGSSIPELPRAPLSEQFYTGEPAKDPLYNASVRPILSKIGRYGTLQNYLVDGCDLLCVLFGCILHRFKRTLPFRIAHALHALSGFSLLAPYGGSTIPTTKAPRAPHRFQFWWPRLNPIASPLRSCTQTGAGPSYDVQFLKSLGQVTHGESEHSL